MDTTPRRGTGIRKLLIVAAAGYVMALHAAAVVALARPAWLLSASVRLGLADSPVRQYFYAATMGHQLRVDKNVPPGAILFFGDSRTQDLCVAAVSPKAVNFGIGTETLTELACRLSRYESTRRGGVVVLASGLVDICRGQTGNLVSDYRILLGALPVDARILVWSVFPVDQADSETNRAIARFNEDLERLCSGDARCRFMKIPPGMVDARGRLSPSCHVGDGKHLSKEGNDIWIQALQGALADKG